MTSHRWTVASTVIALIGLPSGAVAAAAPSAAVAALVLMASPPPAIPRFAVSDLGTLNGAESFANSVNDLSQAAGSAHLSAAVDHAVLYDDGTRIDLGLDKASSAARGINNLGHVVGNSQLSPQAAQHAFLYSAGKMTDLGTLGGSTSYATGVNDADEVVGYSDTRVRGHSFVSGIGPAHAFLHSSGGLQDLGALGGSTSTSAAAGINSIEQVVGYSSTGINAPQHAFLYSAGKMSDLGTLGGTNSTGLGLNVLGQVVGYSSVTDDAAFHAFLDSAGKMSDLGTLDGTNSAANSAANSINALGQVVGFSDTASGVEHACFWEDGMMVDLNSLLPAGSGWELSTASSINDGGEIVGNGAHNGQMRAFLLTPVDGRVLTAQETSDARQAIDQMINQLGAKPTSPRSTVLRFNYLTTKLQVARLKLEQGSRTVAVNLLQSFVNAGSQLTAKELAPDKKKLLMDSAQTVIAALAG
jgi:probable HAF family extracellular repeat protein